jgi:hypothetical protein
MEMENKQREGMLGNIQINKTKYKDVRKQEGTAETMSFERNGQGKTASRKINFYLTRTLAA